MNNPYEVDVSKEDIATTATSQAEAEFFGIQQKQGEESMPAVRGSRPARKLQQEEIVRSDEVVTLIVHSPRHLWGLGAIQFHFSVATTDDAFDLIAKMQENFEWMEEEFADRLANVAALENQISLAQKELLTTLAEEVGEDLPDLTDYSKTEASKLIRELLAARESKPQQTRTSRSRTTTRRPTSGGGSRTSPQRGRSRGGRTGRRTGGGRRQFNNDAPGSATPKMVDFFLDLCRQAGERAPNDDELNSMTFNDVSAEITALREALGYEDN